MNENPATNPVCQNLVPLSWEPIEKVVSKFRVDEYLAVEVDGVLDGELDGAAAVLDAVARLDLVVLEAAVFALKRHQDHFFVVGDFRQQQLCYTLRGRYRRGSHSRRVIVEQASNKARKLNRLGSNLIWGCLAPIPTKPNQTNRSELSRVFLCFKYNEI